MPELAEAAIKAGFELEHVAEIGSTNDTLMAAARQGVTGPKWLVADQQLSGKGRRANHWSSPPGNLYASLLLPEPCEPANQPQLSLLAAVALRRAILNASGLGDLDRLKVKWPNDLLIDGRKAAGLLLEAGQFEGKSFAVIGCGVNVSHHPEPPDRPATDLTTAGLVSDRDHLFFHLSNSFAHALTIWDKGHGFAHIRDEWLQAAFGLGKPIRVNTHTGSFDGIFDSIDPSGQLTVKVGTELRTVGAAEIFMLGGTSGGLDNS